MGLGFCLLPSHLRREYCSIMTEEQKAEAQVVEESTVQESKSETSPAIKPSQAPNLDDTVEEKENVEQIKEEVKEEEEETKEEETKEEEKKEEETKDDDNAENKES